MKTNKSYRRYRTVRERDHRDYDINVVYCIFCKREEWDVAPHVPSEERVEHRPDCIATALNEAVNQVESWPKGKKDVDKVRRLVDAWKTWIE